MLLPGFLTSTIKTKGAEIVVARGGSGPPLLLIHGNPFTHVTWHKIAPRLAERFTVVLPDLRGYGDSSKPPGGGDHTDYSFRAMADDQVEVMNKLGFETFYAGGHDRGARVLHRMCLDYPEKVTKAVFVDALPQHHLLQNITLDWAKFSWHWLFMIQPEPLPEKFMGSDPEFFIRYKLSKTKQGTSFFDPEALSEYIRCIKNPATIHAMCEDYRATVSVDFEMDKKDFDEGKRVNCPVLLVWGAKGGVGRNHDARKVWAEYATNIVNAQSVPSGHYVQEECPDETYALFNSFL